MRGCAVLYKHFPRRVRRQPARVLNGIDVLRRQNFSSLEGKRIGLITNHTGLAADGTPTIDLFHETDRMRSGGCFSARSTASGGRWTKAWIPPPTRKPACPFTACTGKPGGPRMKC